jgi:MFS family permease
MRDRWALFAVILGSTDVFLDTSVVNVALESIGADLPSVYLGVLEGQAYVTSAYLLALAAAGLCLAGGAVNAAGIRNTPPPPE